MFRFTGNAASQIAVQFLGGRRSSLLLAFAACFSLGLSGCALKDEGATDYRRADIPAPVTTKVTDPDGKTREVATPAKIPAETILTGKYMADLDPNTQLEKGEFYEIKLKQGVIADFYDLPLFFDGTWETTGEVAIVVNAFEIGDKTNSLSFGPGSRQQARVIYYSADVSREQYLNLSQLPIFGPAPYTGNAVVVQIYGIEIDQISDRTRSLLTSMAELGSSAASLYNPLAGAASAVLTKLSLAFLNGNHDDIIFSHTFTLAPAGSSLYVNQDYLTEGERVFVRQDDRSTPFDWGSVKLDTANGRLVWAKVPAGKTVKVNEEFRDSTYLVIDVTRTASDLTASAGQKLDALLKELREADGAVDSGEITAVRESVNALVTEIAGDKFLSKKLSTVLNPATKPAQRKAEVFSVLQAIQHSLANKDEATMTEAQIRAVLERLQAKLPADGSVTLTQLTKPAIQGASSEELERIATAYAGG